MENGQVLHSSLYVEQIDKFAVSLKQLAKTFLKLEEKKQTFSEEEIDEMFACVREEVCEKCEKNSWCWGKTIFRCIRWDTRFLQRWISMEMNWMQRQKEN